MDEVPAEEVAPEDPQILAAAQGGAKLAVFATESRVKRGLAPQAGTQGLKHKSPKARGIPVIEE